VEEITSRGYHRLWDEDSAAMKATDALEKKLHDQMCDSPANSQAEIDWKASHHCKLSDADAKAKIRIAAKAELAFRADVSFHYADAVIACM
jgi:hypothetical protein